MNVIEIEADLLLKRKIGPTANLPETGEPWSGSQPLQFISVIVFDFTEDRRSGSHEAHLSTQDIPELW